MKLSPAIVRNALLGAAAVFSTVILTGFISTACVDTEVLPCDVAGQRAPLTDREARVLLPAIRDAVRAGRPSLELPAGALASHAAPCAVLVSVSNGRAGARVVLGRADGLVAAVDRALAQLPRFRGEALETCWVKLDLVSSLKRLETVSRNFEMDPRKEHEGLAIAGGAGTVLLPETLFVAGRVSGNLVKLGTALANLAAEAPERWTPIAGRATYQVRRFRTDAWFTDGTAVEHLAAGRRLVAGLDAAALAASAARAGGYLSRAVGADGRFTYQYRPQSDEVAPGYNALRHAGSTWALLDLCRGSRDASLRDAARRAIGHLLTFVRPVPGNPAASCIVEGTQIKLGGAALAVLALVRYQTVTGDASHEPVVRALGRGLLAAVKPSGRLEPHEMSFPKGKPLAFRSGYFDGEAILALVDLHTLTGEAVWLDAASRAARHVITVRDGKKATKNLTADHWLLYALRRLHKLERAEIFLEHGLRIAGAISLRQERSVGSRLRLGSTPGKAYCTPAATRTEGLVQAYLMARNAGRREVLPELLKSIHLGLAFELAHQFRPETALYYKDPARVMGAFPSSFANPTIRNDYVQHNLSAILGVAEILETEGWKSLDRATSQATAVLEERNQLMGAL